MTDPNTVAERPFRAGIFDSTVHAEDAVRRLLAAGFHKDQVSVLCSDETRQRHFQDFEAPHPSPEDDGNAALAGGALGALLGGLAGAAVVTTGGLAVVVVGPWLLGGAITGTLIGAMSSRGVSKETADFYDQAVSEGQLLIAVEYHGPHAEKMLARAEEAFQQAGAKPLPLAEG